MRPTGDSVKPSFSAPRRGRRGRDLWLPSATKPRKPPRLLPPPKPRTRGRPRMPRATRSPRRSSAWSPRRKSKRRPPRAEAFRGSRDGQEGLRIAKVVGGQYYEKDGRSSSRSSRPGSRSCARTRRRSSSRRRPRGRSRSRRRRRTRTPEDLHPLVEMPASETAVSRRRPRRNGLRFEEISAGLPRSGMWRENFDVGDILGLGHPQIVAPPARLDGPRAPAGLPARQGRRRRLALA